MWMSWTEDTLNGHGRISKVSKRAMGWPSRRFVDGHGVRESHTREGHFGFTLVVDREPNKAPLISSRRLPIWSHTSTTRTPYPNILTAPYRGVYSALRISPCRKSFDTFCGGY